MNPWILTIDQLRCLASPSRHAVYITIRSTSPISAAGLADQLGRSPESVRYHLKALLDVGLVCEAGFRPTARHPEALYEATHQRIQLPDVRSAPEIAALNRKAVLAGIRQLKRGYERASLIAEKEPGLQSRIQVIRMNWKIREEDLPVLLERIEAVAALASELRSDDGVPLHWSSIVYPGDQEG